ncbi:class II fructose-bisphosphate aldolase [Paenibacillus nasutitermitis]|uniref:Fructose-bisphosphate aldolase n=1 Tax=Paenibacillus nasutitermitis TaxID=1652958 RepID=A0A917DS74_9BACL|nr:class II fructose-bisphosphate aldolase [Paenibacillus nasutitermitis]GGD61648.1 fructose-bisphosphate aldolase [Paenibacillus nasutitermitis]
MKLVSGKEMLLEAKSNGFAVGAFSAHNAETVQAILLASAEQKAPVMIQIGQRVIRSIGMDAMVGLIHSLGRDLDAVVAIHLDHGSSFEQAMLAVQLGFQSVMYDGSHLPLDENIRITRQVADAAHALRISVEGEIGRIGGTEDDRTVSEEEAFLTDVSEAVYFSEQTGVDYLAVAVGTAHGLYKGEVKLHLNRLRQIAEQVDKPIVLHGGSGVPDALIHQAISAGVSKINVDTELRQAFALAAQRVWRDDPDEYHLAVVLGEARDAVKQKVAEKIRLFGQRGEE